MYNFKIGQKLLILFIVISIIPIAAINFYWFLSAQQSLKEGAAVRQSTLTSSAVDRVDNFIKDKVNLLIIHSQSHSLQTFDSDIAPDDIANLIKQDSDINNIVLVDSSGEVQLVIDRKGLQNNDTYPYDTDAFRAATFLSGKEYISPVKYDNQQKPFITIAVPLVTLVKGQSLSNLTTAESGIIRSQQDIKGALIATIQLESLWQSVLSEKLGDNGYAYVVDSQGKLVAYPDTDFIKNNADLSSVPQVAEFIKRPDASVAPRITYSEKGQEVLSSYASVPSTKWGVIAQEPIGSIFAAANRIASIGLFIFIIATITALLLSYIFSRRITKPIKQLAKDAQKIASGDLSIRTNTTQHDEIGSLGLAFNEMTGKLTTLIKHAEAESSKLNVILNNIGEGVIAVDAKGNIVVANVAAAVLINELPKNIITKKYSQVYQFTKDGRVFDLPLEAAKVHKDIVLTSSGKSIHYVDILINQIKSEQDNIQTIITIIDKTDERELENMKVDFVSMAAHELRTPMTAVRGYLELLLKDKSLELPEKALNFLLHIQSSSMQLVGLINNLLSVSRIERGVLSLQLDKIDWVDVVKSSISDQLFTAKTKTIQLTYDGPEEPLYILADRISITEIINNLISNAINYTPHGGAITVNITQTNEAIKTSVIDNGVGISPSGLKHLFTKFYRAQNGLSSGSGGTGLGLFISKSIAEMHGGEITVNSVEGEGSCFTISLPYLDEVKYKEISKKIATNVKKRHGWVTKNIAR